MRRYRQSELARTTPVAYKVEGQPRIEVFEVLFPLRSEDLAAAWAEVETGLWRSAFRGASPLW